MNDYIKGKAQEYGIKKRNEIYKYGKNSPTTSMY